MPSAATGWRSSAIAGRIEFAHENTIEAYRATFELGADGNEIDIRETKDGVLVCFHDDMLDRLLELYGDVSEFTWTELRAARFRNPGWLGDNCRIPTLAEVFELHRQHAGLMHLDIKRPGMDTKIVQLLDEIDLWDHVISAQPNTARRSSKTHASSRSSTRLSSTATIATSTRARIEKAMKLDGTALIVDDPRRAIVADGRALGTLSAKPVRIATQCPGD